MYYLLQPTSSKKSWLVRIPRQTWSPSGKDTAIEGRQGEGEGEGVWGGRGVGDVCVWEKPHIVFLLCHPCPLPPPPVLLLLLPRPPHLHPITSFSSWNWLAFFFFLFPLSSDYCLSKIKSCDWLGSECIPPHPLFLWLETEWGHQYMIISYDWRSLHVSSRLRLRPPPLSSSLSVLVLLLLWEVESTMVQLWWSRLGSECGWGGLSVR